MRNREKETVFRRETEIVYRALKEYVRTHQTMFYKDLAGACAIGAFVLHGRLKELGFEPVLVEGFDVGFGGHCWVEVDGYICDPTHEQFKSEEPWFVGKITRRKTAYCWECYNSNPTFVEWPDFQQPVSSKGQEVLSQLSFS